jgi:hypothetical protein
VQEQLALYVDEAVTGRGRGLKRLSLYLGLAVLLAAASLVAVNNRGGPASKFPRVLVPGSSGTCDGTPGNGFLFSKAVDGVRMNVCISQEGNINQIEYPALGSTQIAWDGYCLLTDIGTYADYSPGSGVTFSGWGAATLTQTPPNQVTVTRKSTDGKFQLTEFIKINFQPRSVFVGMTIKNLDAVAHKLYATRVVAPAIDGSAADDQYNEFGVGARLGSTQYGQTGQAFQSPVPGSNSLLFGPTQQNGVVVTETVAKFQSTGSNCVGLSEPPGYVAGGNRVLVGFLGDPAVQGVVIFNLASNASAQVGKFVYRMM